MHWFASLALHYEPEKRYNECRYVSITTSTGVDRDCQAWDVRSFGMMRVYIVIEGEVNDWEGEREKEVWVCTRTVQVADTR